MSELLTSGGQNIEVQRPINVASQLWFFHLIYSIKSWIMADELFHSVAWFGGSYSIHSSYGDNKIFY